MSSKVARLRWQCRRGMLELDAILQPFFESYFSTLSEPQQEDFENLLSHSDQALYAWFIGCDQPEDEKLKTLVEEIKRKRQLML